MTDKEKKIKQKEKNDKVKFIALNDYTEEKINEPVEIIIEEEESTTTIKKETINSINKIKTIITKEKIKDKENSLKLIEALIELTEET